MMGSRLNRSVDCHRGVLCILGVVLTIVPASAGAQEAGSTDLSDLSIQELTKLRIATASRHLEDPRKAPAITTVIDSDEIARSGWRTLGDLLRTVPGFYTAYDRTYLYSGFHGFLQSGDYNARLLLLIDGHRVNENIYDSALIGTEFPLDLSLIERVEVVRGAGSSLFGTDGELAVVNVITKSASAQPDVRITVSPESFGGRTGEVEGSFRLGDTTALFGASMYRSSGVRTLFFPEFDSPETNNGIATNLDGERYDHLFLKLARRQLRIEGFFSSRNKIIPNAPYGTLFGDPRNRYLDARGSLEAAWSHDLSDGAQIDFRAYYDYYRFLGGYPYAGSSPGAPADFFWNEGNNHWVGSELVYGKRVGRHRVVFGGSVEHDLQLKQTNYLPGQRPFFENRQSPTEGALFGELELNLSRHWAVNAGGRFDWQSIYGRAAAPRVAVMYFPTQSTAVKYLYNRSFRAPDPFDEFYVNAGFIDLPNPHLVPEYFGTHTIMAEHALSKHVHIAGNGFLVALQNNIEEQVNSSGESFFANANGDSGKGAEAEISAAGRGWSSRASYTFSRTRDSETRDRLENSPGHLAKLNGTAPIRRYGWMGIELFSSSSQQSYSGVRISPFVLANATFTTPVLMDGLQIVGSCYDVFDRRWATPTGPEVASPATTQNGRSWKFTVTYRRPFSKREN